MANQRVQVWSWKDKKCSHRLLHGFIVHQAVGLICSAGTRCGCKKATTYHAKLLSLSSYEPGTPQDTDDWGRLRQLLTGSGRADIWKHCKPCRNSVQYTKNFMQCYPVYYKCKNRLTWHLSLPFLNSTVTCYTTTSNNNCTVFWTIFGMNAVQFAHSFVGLLYYCLYALCCLSLVNYSFIP